MSRKAEAQRPYKKAIDYDDSRRRREATCVQIRKEKKDDSLQKRRRDADGGRSARTGTSGAQPAASSSRVGALPDPGIKCKLENIPDDVVLLHSADPEEQAC